MTDSSETKTINIDGTVRDEWTRFNQPSRAVIEVIAEASDTDLTELPPLQHTIDAEALDVLIAQSDTNTGIELTFEYANTVVMIERSGTLTIEPKI